ncbi:MAG TPA: acyltransferase family protein [Streptosporangiaceae bacterium]|nr:acyltransferase family protein [Streptosporangiaceae bacterium]
MTSSQDTAVRSRPREQWADNLRVAVIAGVIVVHTATAYVVDIPWYYNQERTTAGVWPMILSPPVLLGALFALGPLFLVAGWFSARSLARRGPGGFVRSRLLRLGVPPLVFVLLINPLTDYVGNLQGEHRSFVSYLAITEVSVMWFVAALLAFSVAYAALRWVRPAARPRPLRPGLLAAAALVIAVGSFAVWQRWPVTGDAFLNLRWGEWPQGAVLFALGVHGAEAGWLEDFPPVLARRLGWVAAAGVGVLMSLMLYLVLARGEDQALAMGADLPTILFATLDGVIAVTGTLWSLSWLRRRWPTHGPLLGKVARASYATYVTHPLVLTAVMVAFAAVALAPEIKFVLIAAAGVAACFTAGYGLTRVPGISKVL